MRTLVLGGTGLISTAVTHQLIDRGDRVTLLNRGTGTPVFGGAVTTVHGDRADPAALAAAWDAHGDGHDAVIDMLCYSPRDAEVALRVFAGKAPRYVMCSTVDVYTKPACYLPVDEGHERRPRTSFRYAYEKARCEEALFAAHHRGDLPVTILRPAATYADHAVPSIGSFDLAVERLKAGAPVILHGDGGSRWAACHRDDVARAFVAATARRAEGLAYNVTGHEALTFEGYWRAVADALGVTPDFVKIPTSLLGAVAPRAAQWCVDNFQYDNVFDCTAAARDLGFAGTVPWAEGIARGLASRSPGQVDPAERQMYDTIVDAWAKATSRMPRGL
jgi:nucleoside-diphosphate-sugar epimerase